MKNLFLALGLLLFLLGANASALTVANTANTGPGSLRQAISDTPDGGTVDFNPALTGQTITLTAEVLVAKNLTIDGSSVFGGITIAGSGARLFSISAGRTVVIRALTLSGGNGAGATANGSGGALYNAGTTTLERCTLSGNAVLANGGAIFNAATLTLTGCTLSGNQSNDTGGAIINGAGAVALTLTHCTVAGNAAANLGGGLMSSSGTTTVINSIISGNSAANGRDVWSQGATAALVRVGANIIGFAGKTNDAPDSGPAAITADPLLGPLSRNGGPTRTMALQAYSQAIDAVPVAAIVAGLDFDQRGFARSLGNGPDLGAAESGAGTFVDDGLTLFARLPVGQLGEGIVFEVSDREDFTVPVPLVSTLAGTAGVFGDVDDERLAAQFDLPSGVAQDSLGNIFVADTANNLIRMLSPAGEVSTIAGTGVYGRSNGPGLSAAFAFPSGIAVGPDNNVYVADTYNHRICKLTRPATAGGEWTVSTLAGTGIAGFLNGAGGVAKFNFPYGLDLDASGNVYVADALNHRIRKVTAAGAVTTLAGSGTQGFQDGALPANARFSMPQGIVVFARPGFPDLIYVADRGNHRIRMITTTTDGASLFADVTTTLAGDGTAAFVDGTGAAARFNSPSSITADADGNLYVADEQNHRVRRITAAGVVSTVAGTGTAGFLDGTSAVARFDAPAGLLVARDGTLVVADVENYLLRTISIAPLRVPAIADPANENAAGVQLSAVLDFSALGLRPDVRYYFRYRLADNTTQPLLGQSIVKVDLPVVVTTAADKLTPTAARMGGTVDPNNLPTDALFEYSTDPGLLAPYLVTTRAGSGVAGLLDSPASNLARFQKPQGVVVAGGDAYVADSLNHRIRKIGAGGAVTTFAGSSAGFVNGTGAAARFDRPAGIAAEPDVTLLGCATTFNSTTVTCASTAALARGASVRGTNIALGASVDSITDATHFVLTIPALGTTTGVTLLAGGANFYVADAFNHCIRKVSASGQVTTFAGSGIAGFVEGAPGQARFLFPTGVAVDTATPPNVYVADSGNHRIRKVAPDGTVTTLAGIGVSGFADGLGEAAQFASPQSVAINPDGDLLVADTGNHLLRIISGGAVSTLAGSTKGFLDGVAASAKFDSPTGVAVDSEGAVYVSDAGNHRIRQLVAGEVTTFAGSGIAGMVNSPAFGLYPTTATQFNQPAAIAVDGDGGVVVTQENLVRHVGRGPLPTVLWASTLTGTAPVPILGDLPGLLPGATYFYRARGTCLQASVTGAILSVTTPSASITVAAGATIADAEILSGQSTTIDFGSTPKGTPVVRQFTIANSTGNNVTVTMINVPSGYQVTSGAGVTVIPPGGTLTFDVTLLALTGGTLSGNVVVDSDAPGLSTFTFPITGVVLDVPAVTTLAATAVQGDAATLNGTVNPKGSETSVAFQWSITGAFDGVLTSSLAGSTVGFSEGVGAAAKFNQPHGLAIGPGGDLFVADTKNHRIRRVGLDGTVTTFAGTGVAGFADGPGAGAQFNEPVGLAMGADGTLFVSDSQNHRIRAITPGGEVRTYSGSPLGLPSFTDGVGIAARYATPWGLAIDRQGVLYVADRDNHRIRKVATDGSVSTLAGTGTAGTLNGAAGVALLDRPLGIAVNAAGSVYFTEAASHAIRRVAPDGAVSLFAGSATTAGATNGTAAAARFSSPVGLAVDAIGSVFVADKGNHNIRKITSNNDGVVDVVTFAGLGTAGTANGLKGVAQFDSPVSVIGTAEAGAIVGELTASTLRLLTPTEPLLPAASGLTGTTTVPVSLQVTGLTVGTTYFYRAVATNARGTSYGTRFSVVAGTPFELWQFANFGAEAGNPLIGGADATPANDGVSNRLKYALGLNPLVSAVGNLPVVAVNGANLTITYKKVLAATDIIYTPEWSSDLVTWNTAGLTEQMLPAVGGTQQVIASIPIAPNRVKFVRLTVSFR